MIQQTLSDWELIVVDDASTDDSLKQIAPFLNDNRIRLVEKKTNDGFTKALIAGIAAARSEIVGILDSDDQLSATALQRVLHTYLTDPDVGVVLTQLFYCDADLVPMEVSSRRHGFANAPMVWMKDTTAFRSFKLAAYSKTSGFNTEIRHAEDWDLLFKLEEVTKICRIEEPLYFYRMLPSSVTNNPETHLIGQRSSVLALYHAYRRRGGQRSGIPVRAMSSALAAAVRYSAVLKQPVEAFRFAARAVRISPFYGSSWRSFGAAIGTIAGRPFGPWAAATGKEAPILLRSYAVRNLQSNTGNREADRIVCLPLVHRKGHCLYGGDFNIVEAGLYEAIFELEVEPASFAMDPLVQLDIYENRLLHAILSEQSMNAGDVNRAKYFSLRFNAVEGQRVEFRAFWFEQCRLKAHGITLKLLRTGEKGAVRPLE